MSVSLYPIQRHLCLAPQPILPTLASTTSAVAPVCFIRELRPQSPHCSPLLTTYAHPVISPIFKDVRTRAPQHMHRASPRASHAHTRLRPLLLPMPRFTASNPIDALEYTVRTPFPRTLSTLADSRYRPCLVSSRSGPGSGIDSAPRGRMIRFAREVARVRGLGGADGGGHDDHRHAHLRPSQEPHGDSKVRESSFVPFVPVPRHAPSAPSIARLSIAFSP